MKYHKWQTLLTTRRYVKNTGNFQHLSSTGSSLSKLGLVGSVFQLQVFSMGWKGGGAHPYLTPLMSPKVVFVWEQKIAVSQSFYWQYHRITEWVGKNPKDNPVPGPHCGQEWHSMVGEIPSFKGTLIKDY